MIDSQMIKDLYDEANMLKAFEEFALRDRNVEKGFLEKDSKGDAAPGCYE